MAASGHNEKAQQALVGAVHDNHAAAGTSKAPAAPAPAVDVHAVEAKPDPAVVDHEPEVLDAADEAKKAPEVAPENHAEALAQALA